MYFSLNMIEYQQKKFSEFYDNYKSKNGEKAEAVVPD